MAFLLHDKNNYFYVKLSSKEKDTLSDCELYQVSNGSEELVISINNALCGYELSTWYVLSIAMSEKSVTLFFDKADK